MNTFTTKGLIGLTALIIIIILVVVLFLNITKNDEPTEQEQNIGVDASGLHIYLNGDFIEYVSLNEVYEDMGAKAYNNKEEISDEIITTYYTNNTQVANINTSRTETYVIKYEVALNNQRKEATRVLIIKDEKGPVITVPEKQTITSSEAKIYDTSAGVIANDNSGFIQVTCDELTSNKPGDYVITCRAKDVTGNESTKKRLIEIIQDITFTNNEGNITINFPDGDYQYYYSLDNGENLIQTDKTITLSNTSNIIAAVYQGEKLLISETYKTK